MMKTANLCPKDCGLLAGLPSVASKKKNKFNCNYNRGVVLTGAGLGSCQFVTDR
jgi:hypothetical protein